MSKRIDPVCGMEINEMKAVGQSNFEGEIYYFCSTDCKSEFDEQPTKYFKQTEKIQCWG